MIPDDFSLHGRVAVVTGGSRGIGSGIVELLAERGAVVGFTFHEHEAPARALEQSSSARGGRIWCAKCDVADDMAVEAFFSRRRRPNSVRSTSWSTTPASPATRT